MGEKVDTQFFDLLTVIDNLMQKNNNLTEQNNALQQRILSILGAIYEKPSILQAPQLTELSLQQQSISIPDNVDIAPQLFIDTDLFKFYVLESTFYVTGWTDLAAGSQYDGGDVKLSDFLSFDLLRLVDFKYVGFNMIEAVTNVPCNVVVGVIKNRTGVFNFFVLPDNSERIYPDVSDPNYNWKSTDTQREIIVNYSSALSVRIYKEWHYAIYKEIPLETVLNYMEKIKKIVLF